MNSNLESLVLSRIIGRLKDDLGEEFDCLGEELRLEVKGELSDFSLDLDR